MKSKASLPAFLLGAVASGLLNSQPVHATTYYWDAGAGTAVWGTAANWATTLGGGTDPSAAQNLSTDDVYFNTSSLNTPQTIGLNGSRNVLGMTFNSTGTTQILAHESANTAEDLTIFSGGILVNSGAGAVTLGNYASNGFLTIKLSGDQSWTNNSSSLLAINAAVTNIGNTAKVTLNVNGSGTGGTTFTSGISDGGATGTTALIVNNTGGGITTLGFASTYTGGTSVSAGTLKIGNATSLGGNAGSVSISSGAVLDLNGVTMTGTNALTLNGTGITTGGALKNSSATAATYAGLVSLGGNSSIIAGTGNIILSNTGTMTGSGVDLTVGGTKTTTINSIIGTGTGGLTKQDSGTLSLTGANTYTGVTTVNAGMLIVQNNSALGTAAGNTVVASGAEVFFGTSNMSVAEPFSISGNGITGTSGALHVGGSATGITLSGLVTLNAAAMLEFDGSTSTTLSGGIDLGANTLIINGGGAITISSGISGTGGLTLTKATTPVILSAANTYSGITTLTGGVLQLNNNLALQNSTLGTSGAGTVSLSGITTATFGGLSGSKDLASVVTAGYSTLVTSLTLNPGNGVSNTYSGVIANGAAAGTGITKTGLGTQILSGINTYTGATTVNAGTLVISGSPTGNSAIGLNSGGTLQLDYSVNNTTKINDSAILTLNGGTLDLKGGSHTEIVASTTLSTGTLSKVTSSTPGSVLQMNAITRNTGAAIDFGASNIANADALNTNGILGTWATVGGADYAMNSGSNTAGGATSGTTGVADGFIRAYAGYTDVNRLTPGTIADGSTTNVRIIEGSGSAGSISLGAATTTINSLNQSASGGTGAATITLSGKTLATNGVLLGSSAGNLTIGATVGEGTLTSGSSGADLVLTNFNTSTKLLVNSNIANNTTASALVKTGPGLVTIASTGSSFTGATRVDSGTLEIAGRLGSAIYNASIVVSPGATLLFSGATNNNPHNNLNGGGSIIKDGSGTLTLDNPNNNSTLSGGYLVKNGGLSGWTTNSFGTSIITMGGSGSTGATLTGGGVTFANAININAPDSGTITVGNAFTASAAATTFNGALTLNGNVTFQTVSNGTTGALTIGGSVTGTGSLTLKNQNTGVSATGGITLSSSAINPIGSITAQGNGSTTTTISGNIGSNVTSVTQSSATAKLVISGTNSYGGNTILTQGTLQVGSASAIPSGAGKGNLVFDTAANTAVFDLNGNDVSINGLAQGSASTTNKVVNNTISTAKTLTVGNNDATSVYSGIIADNTGTGGTLALTKTGTGTLTLAGANSYSGATNVNAGRVSIGTAGTINSTSGIIIGGGELNYNNSTTALTKGITFSGGTGTLSGTGTITPAVTVTGGNRQTAGTSVTSVNATATLGKETFGTGITYESGSIFEWNLAGNTDTTEGTRGTHYDAVNTAALGGTGGAIFRVVLNGAQNFSEAFWDTDRTWAGIFQNVAESSAYDLSTVFNGGFEYQNSTGAVNGVTTSQGSFTFISGGTDLRWTAVPEPTSALAGLMIGAGLFRRRRGV